MALISNGHSKIPSISIKPSLKTELMSIPYEMMATQRILLHLVFVILLSFVMSCASSPSPPTQKERAMANQALEILLKHQTTHINVAFEALSSWSYSRYEFSEHRGTTQYESSIGLERIDASGNSVVIIDPDSASTETIDGIVEAILPEDPPYFSERFVDDFVYDLQRDTSYWSRPAYEIKINSRPGRDHGLVTNSFIYDSDSSQLVHASFHSVNRTILFQEQSSYQIQLRPIGEIWLPYRVTMSVSMKLPMGKQQQYIRNVTYYNFTPRTAD